MQMEFYSYRSSKLGFLLSNLTVVFRYFLLVLHFPKLFKRVFSHYKLYVSMRYDRYLIWHSNWFAWNVLHQAYSLRSYVGIHKGNCTSEIEKMIMYISLWNPVATWTLACMRWKHSIDLWDLHTLYISHLFQCFRHLKRGSSV